MSAPTAAAVAAQEAAAAAAVATRFCRGSTGRGGVAVAAAVAVAVGANGEGLRQEDPIGEENSEREPASERARERAKVGTVTAC